MSLLKNKTQTKTTIVTFGSKNNRSYPNFTAAGGKRGSISFPELLCNAIKQVSKQEIWYSVLRLQQIVCSSRCAVSLTNGCLFPFNVRDVTRKNLYLCVILEANDLAFYMTTLICQDLVQHNVYSLPKESIYSLKIIFNNTEKNINFLLGN